MGLLLPTRQTNVCMRLHFKGHSAGAFDLPLAEASRPFTESRLLKSAVVTVQAAKTVKTGPSQHGQIHGYQCFRTY